MPMLNTLISGAPDAALSAQVAAMLSEQTCRHLGKDPAVTAVAVNYTPREHWFVAGRVLSEHNRNAFWLDIKITEATNTKAEMARYIAEVFAAMNALIGPLHEESYILVDSVPAAAYGYGGRTQEYRYVAGQMTPARAAA